MKSSPDSAIDASGQAGPLGILWPTLIPQRGRIVILAILSLVQTGLDVASPILIGLFIHSVLVVVKGHAAISSALWMQRGVLAWLLAAAIARVFLLAAQRGLAGSIGEDVARRLRDALWRHLLVLPLDATRRRGPGRLLLRFIADARSIQRFVVEGLVRMSQEALLACGILIAMVVINWRMALAVLLALPMFGLFFWRLNPRLREASRATRRQRSLLSAYLHEKIVGMAVVKACVRQFDETSRGEKRTHKLAQRGASHARLAGRLEGLTSGAWAACGVAVLALSAHEVAAGRLTAGTIVAFYTMLGLLVPCFRRVTTANRYWQEARVSLERLAATLAESPEEDPRRTKALEINAGTVTVYDVSFSHDRQRPALDAVSLLAQRGELVALVGPNGSGKSTLLELLLQFRQPAQGRIEIDGQDLSEVSLTSLRSRIGLVTQDAPLFDGTIEENIAYGVSSSIDIQERVRWAARLVGVDRLVTALENGWNTPAGEGGCLLSGGQRQRIALARALAGDPPILILDEATSAMDGETEQALAFTLRELARDKTILVAAHRLATLAVANRIYVLDAGRVVEQGTHVELLESGGVYARLFADQSLSVEPCASTP